MRRTTSRDHASTKRASHDSAKEARKIHHSTTQRDEKLTDLHHKNRSQVSTTHSTKKVKTITSHEAGDSYQGAERHYIQQKDGQPIDVKSQKNRNELHEPTKRKHHSENYEKIKMEEHQSSATAHRNFKLVYEKEISADKHNYDGTKIEKAHRESATKSESGLKSERTHKRVIEQDTGNREHAKNKEGRHQKEANLHHKGDSKSKSNSGQNLEEKLNTLNVDNDVRLIKGNQDNICSGIEEKKEWDINERVDQYDDDFETYDSDFDEAASESHSSSSSTKGSQEKEAQPTFTRTVTNCNQTSIREKLTNTEVYTTSESSAASQNVQLIDFNRSIHSKRGGVYQNLQRRAADLMRLIELEFGSFVSVFDMRPLDEYANYMVRFGQANRSQANIQTQDDALDREIQTDLIEYCPGGGVWTQWPPLDTGECAGKFERLGQNGMGQLGSETMPETNPVRNYVDEVIQDFSCVSSVGTLTGIRKRKTTPLPQSLLPKLRLMMAVLTEECIPELFGSTHDPPVGSDERKLTQHLFHPDDSDTERVDNQTSIHGNSGCVACAFAPNNGDTLLTIHRPATIPPVNPLNDRTRFVLPAGEIIYVWSISGGSGAPKNQLYCPGLSETGFRGANITRAIFSPDVDASMVIGGLADGSICVWDLRANNQSCEKLPSPLPSSLVLSKKTEHPQTDLSHLTTFAKAPIYSTSGVEVQHVSAHPIEKNEKVFLETDSIAEIRRQAGNQLRGKQEQHQEQHQQKKRHHSVSIVEVQLMDSAPRKSTRSNFQFAALDSAGELSLWMIIRPNKSRARNVFEALAGSQTDLGLRPQEHTIHMICLAYLSPLLQFFEEPTQNFRTSSVSVDGDRDDGNASKDSKWLLHLRSKPKVNATALSISYSGDFLIGFSDGTVSKLNRSPSQVVYPRQFTKPFNKAAVLCLATHPNPKFEVFLVGYADGYVRLYHLNYPDQLYEWNLSEQRAQLLSAVKLIWSHTRPTVFFALDSSGRVSSCDLLKTGLQHRERAENEPEEMTDTAVDWGSMRGIEIHVDSATSDQNRIYDFALSSGVLVSSYGHVQQLAAFALIYPEAVKIHWLDNQWCSTSAEELRNSNELIEQLVVGQ